MRLGWNSPPQVRADKISKTTPCKVAGGCRRSTRPLDTSGNSGIFFQYSEIVDPPRPGGSAGSSWMQFNLISSCSTLAGNPAGTGDQFEGSQPPCVIVDVGYDHQFVGASFSNERIDAGTNRIRRTYDGAGEH